MTDSALLHEALEYRRIRAEAKALEAEAKLHNDAVVAELARRRLSPVEIEALGSREPDAVTVAALAKLGEPFELRGIRVTCVAATRTTYDLDELRPLVPKVVLGRVTRTVVDPKAMATEIEMGRVKAVDVGPASHLSVSAPHIVVTGDVAA